MGNESLEHARTYKAFFLAFGAVEETEMHILVASVELQVCLVKKSVLSSSANIVYCTGLSKILSAYFSNTRFSGAFQMKHSAALAKKGVSTFALPLVYNVVISSIAAFSRCIIL